MLRVWLLGSPDPEMAAIERLLAEAGETVVYATVDGKRVHPGNAYRHDPVDLHAQAHVDGLDVIAVECDGTHLAPGEVGGAPCGPTRRLDHHRPGDPGYGLPPKDFLRASSIGQVCEILASEGRLPEVPEEIVLAAAADHCLAAAYRGECPGVDPDDLMRWRAESRAGFQERNVDEVIADVDRARTVLRSEVGQNPYADVRGYGVCDACGHIGPSDRCGSCCLCGAQQWSGGIPELPEAACREGIPFLASVLDRDGRRKIVLQAAPAGLVKQFLDGEIVEGLTDCYGDPARGFAGGYET